MKKSCKARQFSDQMFCEDCNVGWDMNDPHPPECSRKSNQVELNPCRICNSENVGFCECEGTQDGCHLLVCEDCLAAYDLSMSVDRLNECDDLQELREKIAELWNKRAEVGK